MAHMYIRGNYILKDGPAIVGAVDFGLTDPDGSAYETGYTMKSTLELPYGDYDICGSRAQLAYVQFNHVPALESAATARRITSTLYV